MRQEVLQDKTFSNLLSFLKSGITVLGNSVCKTDGLVKFTKPLSSTLALTKFVPEIVPFAPISAIILPLKSFNDFTGAIAIFVRLKDWTCSEEGKDHPFWLLKETSANKFLGKAFFTASNVAETVKYVGAFPFVCIPLLGPIGIAQNVCAIGGLMSNGLEDRKKLSITLKRKNEIDAKLEKLRNRKCKILMDWSKINKDQLTLEESTNLKKTIGLSSCKQKLKKWKIHKINNRTNRISQIMSLIDNIAKIALISLGLIGMAFSITALPFSIAVSLYATLVLNFSLIKYFYDETHKTPIPFSCVA